MKFIVALFLTLCARYSGPQHYGGGGGAVSGGAFSSQYYAPAPAAPPAGAGPRKGARGPPGANLFVLGFPEYFDDDALLRMFSAYGNVLSCNVMRDPATNMPRNYGFVSFENPQQAQAAVQALNGQDLFSTGKKIVVELKK